MLNSRKNFGSLCVVIGLVIGLTFMIVTQVSATEYPGPDEFGYVVSNIESNPREISSYETKVTLGDDEVSGAIPLPFPFLFYGVSVAEVYISSNGFISFSSSQEDGCCEGGPIPNPLNPNNIIAGFWEDLYPPSGGSISYGTLVGADGNREFVVDFNRINHFRYVSPVTFQIILHEGRNDIELQYISAESDGGIHTVGIEDADGIVGLQIANGDVFYDHVGFLIHNRLIEKFEVESANVSFGRGQELDKYDIKGEFTLPESSDGNIDPVAEEVIIKVGTYSIVIPANSFEAKKGKEGVKFQGSVDGALVHASIEVIGPLSFRYHIEAHKVDLTDSPIPLKFSLKIGTDVGVTTIPLHGYLRMGKKQKYRGLETRLKKRLSKRNYFRRSRR